MPVSSSSLLESLASGAAGPPGLVTFWGACILSPLHCPDSPSSYSLAQTGPCPGEWGGVCELEEAGGGHQESQCVYMHVCSVSHTSLYVHVRVSMCSCVGLRIHEQVSVSVCVPVPQGLSPVPQESSPGMPAAWLSEMGLCSACT